MSLLTRVFADPFLCGPFSQANCQSKQPISEGTAHNHNAVVDLHLVNFRTNKIIISASKLMLLNLSSLRSARITYELYSLFSLTFFSLSALLLFSFRGAFHCYILLYPHPLCVPIASKEQVHAPIPNNQRARIHTPHVLLLLLSVPLSSSTSSSSPYTKSS